MVDLCPPVDHWKEKYHKPHEGEWTKCLVTMLLIKKKWFRKIKYIRLRYGFKCCQIPITIWKWNYRCINFPTPATPNQISKVEKQNDLAINVYGYFGHVYPSHITKTKIYVKNPINLILINEDENITIVGWRILTNYVMIKPIIRGRSTFV